MVDHIKDINEVRSGFHAQTFGELLKHGFIKITDVNIQKKKTIFSQSELLIQENLAFTIMYNNYRNELHLMASNKRTRDLWTEGIEYLIARYARKSQLQLIKEERQEDLI